MKLQIQNRQTFVPSGPARKSGGYRRPAPAFPAQPKLACACGGGCPRCRSVGSGPALNVSQPGDRDELEADRMADRALRSSGTPSTADPGNDPPRRAASSQGLPPGGSGKPLPESVRTYFEPRFGLDFTHVRLHDDQQSRQTAARLDARAFTFGGHIWLGGRESASDTRLMAHELAHVVQQTAPGGQTGAAPRLQRERLPCTSRRVVDLYAVSLPGSSRSPSTDVATANGILCQCGIELNLTGGVSWSTTLLDLQAPAGTLNEYSSMSSPTSEETTMLAYAPGGSAIHAYYVPAMSASRGENFRPTVNPAVPRAVVVSDSAASDTLAHELGHILFDVSGHDADPNNLMATGSVRKVGVDELRTDQCSRS